MRFADGFLNRAKGPAVDVGAIQADYSKLIRVFIEALYEAAPVLLWILRRTSWSDVSLSIHGASKWDILCHPRTGRAGRS